MPGHVHKRTHRKKSGETSVLYYAVVELARVDGKRRSDWGPGFRRKKDADAALVTKLANLASGNFVERSNLTVAECLGRYLEASKGVIKATAYAGNVRSVEHYLVPYIGDLRLQELDAGAIQRLSSLLSERGGRRVAAGELNIGQPLSPKTVRNHLGVLGTALAHAVKMGWLSSNPMDAVRKPSARRSKQMNVWDADEVAEFLAATGDHGLHPLFHLALYSGARRGELLGLRWADIDFKARQISIRQNLVLVDGALHFDSPKSHGARTVDLDSATMEMLAQLKVASRTDGSISGSRGLVFTNQDGSPIRPDSASQWFDRAVAASTVSRRITFHEMRHTHATLLLRAGVPVHIVSLRLGHADVGFTLSVYAHALPGQQADAASAFAEAIHGAGRRVVRAVDTSRPASAG